jgi:hypothetical protein
MGNRKTSRHQRTLPGTERLDCRTSTGAMSAPYSSPVACVQLTEDYHIENKHEEAEHAAPKPIVPCVEVRVRCDGCGWRGVRDGEQPQLQKEGQGGGDHGCGCDDALVVIRDGCVGKEMEMRDRSTATFGGCLAGAADDGDHRRMITKLELSPPEAVQPAPPFTLSGKPFEPTAETFHIKI